MENMENFSTDGKPQVSESAGLTLAGTFILLIAIAVSAIGIIPGLIDAHTIATGATVQGTVVGAKENNNRGRTSEEVQVTYMLDGDTYTVKEIRPINRGFAPTDIGETVTVYYDVADPERATVKGWEKGLLTGIITGVVFLSLGIILTGNGLYLTYKAKRLDKDEVTS
ncbi:MAG: DUF3592 domain-containing protein [Enterococcus sp.]|nr:DUF3592 domain-containing protein [Enterococcus sp.]